MHRSFCTWRPATTGLVCALALACGGTDPVELILERIPLADPQCGVPEGANTVRIRALGQFPVSATTVATFGIGEDVVLSQFPRQIEALAVEVLGPSSDPISVGRTAPFDFERADPGDPLPVFMAPVDGACEVAGLGSPRIEPLAARIMDQVLVTGGHDGTIGVAGAELYDTRTASFRTTEAGHYGTDERGIVGASLTSVGDLAVAVGGPVTAWQSWDRTGQTSGPQFLPEARAFHAAVALDETRLFLAAGCSQVTSSLQCEVSSTLRTTSILDIESGDLTAGPRLQQDRLGGAAYLDGNGSIVLVGGRDMSGALVMGTERVVLGEMEAVLECDASGAASAQLISGSLVTGFGDQSAASGALYWQPSGAADALALVDQPVRSDPTMTVTEDGAIVILGGGQGAARLRPLDGRLLPMATTFGAPRSRHGATVLADGSILVVGGADEVGQARADAWLLRPPLSGPLSNDDVTVRFGEAEAARAWVPRSLASLQLVDSGTPYAQIESSQDKGIPSEFALVAGPELSAARIVATLSAPAGLGVFLGYKEGRGWLVSLRSGQRASVGQIEDGVLTEISGCQQQEVVADADLDDEGAPISLSVELSATTLQVRSGERRLLRCDTLGQPPMGFVGLGAFGSAGARLRVDAMTASRRLP